MKSFTLKCLSKGKPRQRDMKQKSLEQAYLAADNLPKKHGEWVPVEMVARFI